MVGFGGGGINNNNNNGKMITIEQLQVGSIVNPISGDHRFNQPLTEVYCKIVSINETSCEAILVNDDTDASPLKFKLTNIAGIPLTEKILTEWCGWEEMYRSSMHLTLEFEIKQGEWVNYYEWYDDDGKIKSKYIEFKGINFGDIALHQLQLLCFALTQTALPIQIN